MATPTATAQLTGSHPFPSFTVPGADPSVLVTRRPTPLDADALAALKKALKAKAVPGVTEADVLIEEPASEKASGKKGSSKKGDS